MVKLYNESLINELEDLINIKFNDKYLLQRALTHKSFANENAELNLRDNERLEFLGDSVLSISISTYIFHNFPNYPEGELAKMRAVIVSAPVLAQKGKEMGIGSFLLLGKGEEATGGRNRESILADAMEALFGAIYLDQGFNVTMDFIINLFKDIIEIVKDGEYIQDYKTMLQEIIQKNGDSRPIYNVIEERGPDHNKTFRVVVKFNNQIMGSGSGTSKKEAEQKAARKALENLGEI